MASIAKGFSYLPASEGRQLAVNVDLEDRPLADRGFRGSGGLSGLGFSPCRALKLILGIFAGKGSGGS